MGKTNRVVVIGLDGVPPKVVFEKWRGDLAALSMLASSGLHGRLRSTDPPITIPAWTSMFTGKDPGELGCYGFRNRRDRSYGPLALADSTSVRAPWLWTILSRRRLRSVVIGVPQTYPPMPLKGALVSGFMAPHEGARFTYPPELKEEMGRICPDYEIDVPNFRHLEKEHLARKVTEMTRNRFRLVRHFMERWEWDLLIAVEIGPDRMHHGFWRFLDPEHPAYERVPEYETLVKEYYKMLDGNISEILEILDDRTSILVVSDHGARPMKGLLRLNEWLKRKGYLRLKEDLASPVALHPSMVDWSHTLAWAEGGYYGRIYLNVRGREPHGIVPPSRYGELRGQLAQELVEMVGPDGSPLGNRVLIPEEIYRATAGIPPDIMLYAGDLSYRVSASVGGEEIFSLTNDTGPDDANHDIWGMYILYQPWRSQGFSPTAKEASILDIAPTILEALGVDGNFQMGGRLLE